MKRPDEYALIEKVLFAARGSVPPVTAVPSWMRATLVGAGLIVTVSQCGGTHSGSSTTANQSTGDSPTCESPQPDTETKSTTPVPNKETPPPPVSASSSTPAMAPPDRGAPPTPVTVKPPKRVSTTPVSFTGATLVRCRTPRKTAVLGSVLYHRPSEPGPDLISLSRPTPMYGGPRLNGRGSKLVRAEFSYNLPDDAPNDLRSVIHQRKYRMVSCLRRHFQETRCIPRSLYGSMAITIARGRVQFKMLGLTSPILKKCIASCRTSVKNTRYSAVLKAKIKALLHSR